MLKSILIQIYINKLLINFFLFLNYFFYFYFIFILFLFYFYLINKKFQDK